MLSLNKEYQDDTLSFIQDEKGTQGIMVRKEEQEMEEILKLYCEHNYDVLNRELINNRRSVHYNNLISKVPYLLFDIKESLGFS